MNRYTFILTSFCCWLVYFPSYGISLEGFRWRNTQLFLKFPSIFKGTFLFENDKYPPVELYDPEFKPPKVEMMDDGLPLIDVDNDITESMQSYEFLPLLPESTVAFPGSKHFLFINEMKFRELFSDMNKRNDQRLVRCFVREDGGVEPEACICRVKESKPLISGGKYIHLDLLTLCIEKAHYSSILLTIIPSVYSLLYSFFVLLSLCILLLI